MSAILAIYELAGDADFACGFSHAPFQHVANTELASDLSDVRGATLIGKARIARDHEQRLEVRKRGNNVLDDAVGEVLLLRIAAHVLEGQHGDRGLVGQSELFD